MLKLSVNKLSFPVAGLALLISIGLLAHFGSLSLMAYIQNTVARTLAHGEEMQKVPSLLAPVTLSAEIDPFIGYVHTFKRHAHRFRRETVTLRKSIPFFLAGAAVYTTAFAGVLVTWGLAIAAIYLLFRKKWLAAFASLLAWKVPLVVGLAVPLLFELVVSSSTARLLNLTLLLVGILAVALVYWLPAIVAFVRRKNDRRRLLLLNLFFGLVPLVWPILFCMSFLDTKKVAP